MVDFLHRLAPAPIKQTICCRGARRLRSLTVDHDLGKGCNGLFGVLSGQRTDVTVFLPPPLGVAGLSRLKRHGSNIASSVQA